MTNDNDVKVCKCQPYAVVIKYKMYPRCNVTNVVVFIKLFKQQVCEITPKTINRITILWILIRISVTSLGMQTENSYNHWFLFKYSSTATSFAGKENKSKLPVCYFKLCCTSMPKDHGEPFSHLDFKH